MRLSIVSTDTEYDIVIEHGSEKLVFGAKMYRPNKNKTRDVNDREDPFHFFNMFIASKADKGLEQALFNSYKVIYDHFMVINNEKMLFDLIKHEVEFIYSQLTYQDFFSWVRMGGVIEPPNDIKKEYTDIHVPNINYGSDGQARLSQEQMDKTYIRKDYWELMVLSIVMRPMVPIWSVFFGRLKDINLKESYMLELLSDTYIVELDSMARLRTYIKEISKTIWENEKTGYSTTAVLTGLGEEESVEFAMASSIIKKLAVGELARDPISLQCSRGNLVSNIYRIVDTTYKNLNKRQQLGKVQDKIDKTKKDNTDDNNSVLDACKVKQVITDGDRVLISYLGQRARINARLLEPEIDLSLVDKCVESAFRREIDPVADAQITLIKYVIDPVIEAKSVLALNKTALTSVMAVCQAVLIHRGYMDLAVLSTALAEYMEDDLFGSDDIVVSFGDIDLKNFPISKPLVEELNIQYECRRQPSTRQGSIKNTNPAVNVIDKMAREFLASNWKEYMPDEFKSLQKPWICPPNIRDSLARFIIERNKRPLGN